MKKKWLVFGLTAVVGLGCLFACDEGGEGGQVSATDWTNAINNISFENVVMDAKMKMWDGENVVTNEQTYKMVVNGNNIYTYDESFYLSTSTTVGGSSTQTGTRKDYDKTEEWLTEIDGVTYVYEKDRYYDEETGVWGDWQVAPWEVSEHETVAETKEELEFSKQMIDIYLQMGVSAFTYDKEKESYVMSVSTADVAIDMEVQIVNGEVYSLFVKENVSMSSFGEGGRQEIEERFTFKTETITLPEQDKLNAVVEGVNIEGTYKFFKMIYGGQTISVGENGITEDYFVVELNEDGTAIVNEKGAETLEGTWRKGNGKEIIITMEGTDRTFIKDGYKLTLEEGEGAIEMILIKS